MKNPWQRSRYTSSDESEYSTPNTTPNHKLECIYPDLINQLIASQLEQRSNMGTETIFYLCQHVQPIPDTPESPTPENRERSDDFYPDNIPLNNPPQYHRSSR